MLRRRLPLSASAVLVAVLSASAAASEAGPAWGYSGAGGPPHWAGLDADFVPCGKGTSQSPVELGEADPGDTPRLGFQYRTVPLAVTNNGHTIQVDYSAGSYLYVGERRFELLQFHFHTPSEHSLRGRHGDMVAHLVHQAADGELAVVAVVMNATDDPHPELEHIWRRMPSEVGSHREPGDFVNAQRLLPTSYRYFTYSGSLTTPPCSEGVRWIVLMHPTRISRAQASQFREVVGPNARPLQPVNGRRLQYTAVH